MHENGPAGGLLLRTNVDIKRSRRADEEHTLCSSVISGSNSERVGEPSALGW